MNVAQLKLRLVDYDDTDQLPLLAIVPDLPYLVAALEEWQAIQEMHGHTSIRRSTASSLTPGSACSQSQRRCGEEWVSLER